MDSTLLIRHSPRNTRCWRQEPSSGLAKTHSKLRHALQGHAAELCRLVGDADRDRGGRAGWVRLHNLELLVSMLGQVSRQQAMTAQPTVPRSPFQKQHADNHLGLGLQDHESALTHMGAEFWTPLLGWVFDRPANNVLHGFVYQLVYAAVRAGHASALQALLVEADLIPQMVAAFESQSHSSMRGHLLLIANTLRLGAERSGGAGELAGLLRANSEWQEFLPTVRR